MANSAKVAAYVSALVQGATQAVRDQDMERVVDCLVAAVELYERHQKWPVPYYEEQARRQSSPARDRGNGEDIAQNHACCRLRLGATP